jgi:hypothetical protein
VIYQWLIHIGASPASFECHQQARRFDPAADRQGLHRGAQAHVDRVRRNAQRPRYVLGFHVLIDETQAITLSICQLRKLWRERIWPYCHSNTAPRWSGNVKAVCQIFIKPDAHRQTRLFS